MIDRRALIAGSGALAVSGVIPAIAMGQEEDRFPLHLSERWMAYTNTATDEIWWRWDICNALVLGTPLLFPFPSKGVWRLDWLTEAMLHSEHGEQMSAMWRKIYFMPRPSKLTLRGPLREHRSSDHECSMLGAYKIKADGKFGVDRTANRRFAIETDSPWPAGEGRFEA